MAERIKQEFLVERHAFTNLVVYEVTGDDLDSLERETLSISEDFSFALAALAVAVSFTIALATTKIDVEHTFDVFWIVTIVGYVASLFFGIRWLHGRSGFKTVTHRIRERGGPLGQEGKEIEATELARLEPEASPEK